MAGVRALRRSIVGGALLAASLVATSLAWGQAAGPAAWRVECAGDGKVLACHAIQQVVTREDNKLVAQAVARLGPDKAPQLVLQLPLGLNVAEPVTIRVDAGKEEKVPLQTCTNAGCYVTLPLKDPLLASLRTGQQLKLAVKATTGRVLNIDLTLLGFGLAFDKATK